MNGKHSGSRKGTNMIDIVPPLVIMMVLIAIVVPAILRGKAFAEERIVVDTVKLKGVPAATVEDKGTGPFIYDFYLSIDAEYTGKFEDGETKIDIVPVIKLKETFTRPKIDGASFFSVTLDKKQFSGTISGSVESKLPPIKDGSMFSGEIKSGESFLMKSSEGGSFLIRLKPIAEDIDVYCDPASGICTSVTSCEHPEFILECRSFEDKFSLKSWKQCESSKNYGDCKKEYTNICKGYFYMQMGDIDCKNSKVTGLRIDASGGEDFEPKEEIELMFLKNTKCVEDLIKGKQYKLLSGECPKDFLASHAIRAKAI